MGVVGLFSRQLLRTCGFISSIHMCETELRVKEAKKVKKKKSELKTKQLWFWISTLVVNSCVP